MSGWPICPRRMPMCRIPDFVTEGADAALEVLQRDVISLTPNSTRLITAGGRADLDVLGAVGARVRSTGRNARTR